MDRDINVEYMVQEDGVFVDLVPLNLNEALADGLDESDSRG